MVEKPYRWDEGATLGDHSKRKHKILREYFRRYLWERCKNPLSHRFRLAVVDGFAGGGYFEDGSEGSPVIFAETLLNTVKEINAKRTAGSMPKVDIDCLLILNDIDPDVARMSLEAVAPFEAASRETSSNVTMRVELEQGEFETLIGKISARIESERYRNVIYNLDQCGHSHVNRATITRLINSEKSVEIFLTYAIQALIAFLNPDAVRKRLEYLDPAPEALQIVDELLEEGGVSKQQWLGAVERFVFDHFGQSAPFVTPFSIHNPDGWRYWFMHFASNYRARQVYNDVLHDNSSQQAHFGRAGLRMLSYNPKHEKGQLYLFDKGARDAARRQLPEDIPRMISEGSDVMGIQEFYQSIYKATPAHSEDIHAAIFENEDLEVLTPAGNPRQSPRRISLDDTLRLKRQLSFFSTHTKRK